MNKIVSSILFVIFLALSLVCLLACIGLGVAGILLSSSGERDLSYYWMIGASAAVIPLPLFCTLVAKFLVDFLILHGVKKIQNKDSTNGTDLEMVEIPRDNGSHDDNDDLNGKFIEAEFYPYFIPYIHTDKFNKLSFPAALLFFTSLVFFFLSLLGLMWMIFVAFDYQNQPMPVVWPFIVTECIAGLVCPIFLFIGGTFLGIVVGFITAGQVDPKLTMTLALPAVKLNVGELIGTQQQKKFWVIVDQFYMPIRDPCGEKTDLRHAIDPSCSTWLLTVLSGLAVILATSFFVNQNVVESRTVSIQIIEMTESDICINYDCFAEETFEFVNCTPGSNLSNHNFLHCFRFYHLAVDVDLISILGITAGFFVATIQLFRLVFVVANVLMHIRQSKLWGILISIGGVIIFIGALVVLFSSHHSAIHLDVIKVGQFFILSIHCFLIGILLCTSEVREIVPISIKRMGTLAKPKHLREGADRHNRRQAMKASIQQQPPPVVAID